MLFTIDDKSNVKFTHKLNSKNVILLKYLQNYIVITTDIKKRITISGVNTFAIKFNYSCNFYVTNENVVTNKSY